MCCINKYTVEILPVVYTGDKLNRGFTTVLSTETEYNTKTNFAMLEMNGENSSQNLTL
jgi:hypothetical protein